MRIERLYQWIAQTPDVAADAILGAGLTNAEPEWATRMIQTLLGRNSTAAWCELVRHFSRLAPEQAAQVCAQPDWTQMAIAAVLRDEDAEHRLNAIQALARLDSARVAYLLPPLLRDGAPAVRAQAASALRALAERFVEPPAASDNPEEYRKSRGQVASALREALRTFDLHHRVELLESATWFSVDLGESLWSQIQNHRSRVGTVIGEHLAIWNHPRMAAFLLESLKHPAWRGTAAQLLKSWRTPGAVAAILSQSELLEDEELRGQLGALRSPVWFNDADDDLSNLPPELKVGAVRWTLTHCYGDEERLALYGRWLSSREPRLRGAAIAGAATLTRGDVSGLLRTALEVREPYNFLARWALLARDSAAPQMLRQAAATAAESALTAPEFEALWVFAESLPIGPREPLAALLRDFSPQCDGLATRAGSAPTLRARTWCMQYLNSPELLTRHARAVLPMLRDPAEQVRASAQYVFGELIGAESGAAPKAPLLSTSDPLRKNLYQTINRMSAAGGAPQSAELRELHELLTALHTPVGRRALAGAGR